MNEDADRFRRAITLMDAANSLDPRLETVGDADWPKENLYAVRMSEWLLRLDPDASEPLRLAVRCQHLERWKIPRSEYPGDRAGYFKWRRTLSALHARRAGLVLQQAGYGPEIIERVGHLVRKENLAGDPEAQTLEDTACLVFLQYALDAFRKEHPESKVLGILAKTWKKMSGAARKAAADIPFGPETGALIQVTLAGGRELE